MVAFSDLAVGPTTGNVYTDKLIADYTFRPGYVISYGFVDLPLWNSTGAATAFREAIGSWAAVANITAVEVPNYTAAQRATTTWVESLGNPSGDNSVLGQHSLPGTNDLEGFFNQNHQAFSPASNVRGGFSFITFVHELGHGLGLEHPHTDGGDTSPPFPGAADSGSLGSNNLNQGVYTVMSYNDGSSEVGRSPTNNYGWALGPMAFDIAAIQRIYGANTSTGAGDTTYTVQGINATGTGYLAIWDASGTDTITAAGLFSDTVIDLRAATLLNEAGGGGWLSRPDGIFGGFTIANGVVIENGTGGSGRDRLVGNSASNILNGGGGFDLVDYSSATANLRVDLSAGTATGTGIGNDTLISIEHARGGSANDTLFAIAGVGVSNRSEIVKPAGQANNSQATALSLDSRFGNDGNANIANSATQSHATVKAVGNGGLDYYSFTVGAAGGTIVVDIDGTFGADTVVAILNAGGTVVASNDDGASLDPGSTADLDSLLSTILAGGVYTVRVGTYSAGGDIAIPAGQVYTLNISAPLTAIPPSSGTFSRGSVLEGGAGNDTLVSGSGNDTLEGGAGSDFASFSRASAGVTANLNTNTAFGDGQDILINIESIVGSAFVDDLIGDANANVLSGGDGDDQLDGRGGNNVLDGGAGDDNIIGGDNNDALIGGTGADRLNGGLGSNELIGGTGNDIYIIAVAGDSIVEGSAAGDGLDEVQTALTSLSLATNVENLTYTGAVSFVGQGNAGNNVITGGTARDELFGRDGNDTLRGGTGTANTLIGGLGDDIYFALAAGDSTIESVGQGIDEVRTTFSIYGLQANIENLAFTDNEAHRAGVGNILNNILTGGSGGDDLFGREGNDTLRGGAGTANTVLGQEGDDIYIIEASGDSVIEFANQGIDTVQTALAQFSLRDHVENLTYTGAATFTGIGFDNDNTLRGGANDDFLSGLGGNDIIISGSGADTVLGGTGADQFRTEGGESGADRILDFTSGSDKIALRDASFAQTATIALVQGSGALAATTANSTFLYQTNTGQLFFDIDGNGAGAAVLIANLNTGLTLAPGDFVFY